MGTREQRRSLGTALNSMPKENSVLAGVVKHLAVPSSGFPGCCVFSYKDFLKRCSGKVSNRLVNLQDQLMVVSDDIEVHQVLRVFLGEYPDQWGLYQEKRPSQKKGTVFFYFMEIWRRLFCF